MSRPGTLNWAIATTQSKGEGLLRPLKKLNGGRLPLPFFDGEGGRFRFRFSGAATSYLSVKTRGGLNLAELCDWPKRSGKRPRQSPIPRAIAGRFLSAGAESNPARVH